METLLEAMGRGRVGSKFRPVPSHFPSRPRPSSSADDPTLAELKAANARLVSQCAAQSREIRELVNQIDRMKQQRRRYPSGTAVDAIIDATCDYYDITPKEFYSPYMGSATLRARHVACYIIKQMTGLSWVQIGRKLKKNPTTIGSAAEVTHERRQVDKQLDTEIVEIMSELDRAAARGVAA